MTGPAGAAVDQYLAAAEALLSSDGVAPAWLAALRRDAVSAFASLGLPSRSDESWRLTDVEPLRERPFLPAPPSVHPSASAGAPHVLALDHRLTFVDGRLSPALSSVGPLPGGAVIDGLAAVLAREPGVLESRLGHLARAASGSLVALNTALATDGAVVIAPPGADIGTIHLLHVSLCAGPHGAFPRHVICAAEGARATVVEHYVSLDGAPDVATPDHTKHRRYLTCAVAEADVGAGAAVSHYYLQEEGLAAVHYAALRLCVGAAGAFAGYSVASGSGMARSDLEAVLAGEAAECSVDGLYLAGSEQLLDTTMLVRHAAPRCTSRAMYKGVLTDRARGVFSGKIHVEPRAGGTDARQTNRSLLLSGHARAYSNPQLEIYSSDVKCTHGSTVGQLDQDALFYLRSRGIAESSARAILTQAFAGEIVDAMDLAPVARRARRLLAARLAADLGQAAELELTDPMAVAPEQHAP